MITRLIILLAALYGLWTYGIDGIRISLQGRTPQTYTAQQVIDSGVGGARYVRITGFTDGTYVYQTPDKDSSDKARTVNRIEYALLPEREFDASLKAVLTGEAHVTPVRIMASDSRVSPGCQTEKKEGGDGCLTLGERTIEGIVRTGLDALTSETRDLFNEDGDYRVSDNVLYITEGDRPAALWVPVLITVALTLLSLLMLFTFIPTRRRAS
ncbi:hypothetical protein [Deinococcus sp.]|uniref:hypothetical protein n=1 Tax=Deinococcus sp. TaxID=47478 RepID=UPI0025BD3E20|nr:hypothetical protein [Deinococcus sp.]